MTDSRRSTRPRKTVNYSKLCDDESDDDFKEESSAPQNKRKKNEASPKSNISKKETRTNKGEKGRKSSDEEYTNNKKMAQKQLGRISVSEKVLARDLQNAIELSKQGTSIFEHNDVVNTKRIDEDNTKKTQVLRKETEVMSNETIDESIKKNQASGKKTSTFSENESEDDHENNWSKSDDSDDVESDWSESEKKTNEAKLIKTVKTKSKTVPVKAVAEARPKKDSQTYKDSQKLVQGVSKPLKIPATGLRLGLSRKAFVKSLHPAVRVQQ